MTREELRRENARKLASGKGGKADFARLVSMEPSQVSQLIGPSPTKNIGNSIARRIERAYQLPEGWLDESHPESPMRSEDEESGAADVSATANKKEAPAAQDDLLLTIVEMIEIYRLSGPRERQRIDAAFSEVRDRLSAIDEAKRGTT